MHDSERDAFESQIEALGKNTTLLVDTYNIEEAVKTAVEVAGPELGGVRIDSGDLAAMAQRVRNQLDALGATNTTITVTNDLDEYALAALQTAPVDSYGVGTMLVTGSGAPTCAMVYKLTEREGADGTMVPVMKKSKDKATVPVASCIPLLRIRASRSRTRDFRLGRETGRFHARTDVEEPAGRFRGPRPYRCAVAGP
mgnify:CR=1 FL=1